MIKDIQSSKELKDLKDRSKFFRLKISRRGQVQTIGDERLDEDHP